MRRTSTQTHRLLAMKKPALHKLLKNSEAIALLCNQAGWNMDERKYTFQWMAGQRRLKTVFIPEHGLFGELQDQVKLNDTSLYQQLAPGVEWISLYNSTDHSLTASEEKLRELDTLIIDLQDTGSRYYTYISTTWLLLKKITVLNLDIKIIVLDKPNPAGRQVEGTRITSDYASFIGTEGLPHRHGLTMGELCRFFQNKLNGKWKLVIEPIHKSKSVFISPSPNIPGTTTCSLYSGQCLWEGTNISEGRGTTLPFETIGAPFLQWVFNEEWNNSRHVAYNKHCWIRPLIFIPVYHKFAHQLCQGIHLHVHEKEKYHSLSHSLQLVKFIREKTEDFEWREGSYEAFNDKKAIELIIGDQLLLDYMNNKTDWKEVKLRLSEEESAWIKETSTFLEYKQPLKKLKIK